MTDNNEVVGLLRQKVAESRLREESVEAELARVRDERARYETALDVLTSLPEPNGNQKGSGEAKAASGNGKPPLTPSRLPNLKGMQIKDAALLVLMRAGAPLRARQIAEIMDASGFEYTHPKGMTQLRDTVSVALERLIPSGKVAKAGTGLFEYVEGPAEQHDLMED